MVLILHQKNPSLKCLYSAPTHLFPSRPAGFQRIVSNCWTTGPKDRNFVFRPCKEQRMQCVYVCACSATLLSARKKEELEREGGFNMQIPPAVLSASSHIVHSNTDVGHNEMNTQVNSAERSQWVQLTRYSCACTDTRINISVLSETHQGGVCVSLDP